MFYKINFCSKLLLFPLNRNYGTIASKSTIITKIDAKHRILSAKNQSDLTFERMARKLGKNKVWLTSAIYGEQPFDAETAFNTLRLIGITSAEEIDNLVKVMQQIPEIRGDNERYRHDPLIYRLFEIVQVYGPTFKALISEMSGNGILSAIDCTLDCDKYIDKSTNSERIVIKIDGKYLKYAHKD